MNLNILLLRQISVLSMFFGMIAGFLTLIPFIGMFSFLFLICFVAPLVIWLLIKYGCISLSSVNDGIIIGAISGFVAYLSFSIIFIPISFILMKLFHFAANYGVGMIVNNAGFFILFITSIFIGVIGATINAFTGFITFYVIEFINSIKK